MNCECGHSENKHIPPHDEALKAFGPTSCWGESDTAKGKYRSERGGYTCPCNKYTETFGMILENARK